MAKKKPPPIGGLPPICQTWREQAQRNGNRSVDSLVRMGSYEGGGMFFQIPKNWSDGKPGIRYVEKGIHKGRVRFESRREAKELAKRLGMEYDP